MEFKLNKIDTDIKRKLQEETNEKRIHNSKSIENRKDLIKNKREKQNKNNDGKRRKQPYSNNIEVDAVKYSNKLINVKAEKTDITNVKGTIIDTKK